MKKKFTICIEESISKEFEVEANDVGEALDIAEAKYKNCEFVLDGDASVTVRQMAVVSPDDEATEWTEF